MVVTLKLKEEVHFVCITPTFENSDLNFSPDFLCLAIKSYNSALMMMESWTE